MSKQINITYKGKPYTLEFNRRTIEILFTKLDFVPSEDHLVRLVQLPKLFRGALLMHHQKLDGKITDELYDAIVKSQGTVTLLAKLTELYYEPLASLIDEPENGGDEKNGELEISW